jgi:hypothetical protein
VEQIVEDARITFPKIEIPRTVRKVMQCHAWLGMMSDDTARTAADDVLDPVLEKCTFLCTRRATHISSCRVIRVLTLWAMFGILRATTLANYLATRDCLS